VQVDVDGQLTLHETTATLVLPVAQQSLHNARHHAQPRNVRVRHARTNTPADHALVDDGQCLEVAAEFEPAISVSR
jgi:signal transduction histidine kinase